MQEYFDYEEFTPDQFEAEAGADLDSYREEVPTTEPVGVIPILLGWLELNSLEKFAKELDHDFSKAKVWVGKLAGHDLATEINTSLALEAKRKLPGFVVGLYYTFAFALGAVTTGSAVGSLLSKLNLGIPGLAGFLAGGTATVLSDVAGSKAIRRRYRYERALGLKKYLETKEFEAGARNELGKTYAQAQSNIWDEKERQSVAPEVPIFAWVFSGLTGIEAVVMCGFYLSHGLWVVPATLLPIVLNLGMSAWAYDLIERPKDAADTLKVYETCVLAEEITGSQVEEIERLDVLIKAYAQGDPTGRDRTVAMVLARWEYHSAVSMIATVISEREHRLIQVENEFKEKIRAVWASDVPSPEPSMPNAPILPQQKESFETAHRRFQAHQSQELQQHLEQKREMLINESAVQIKPLEYRREQAKKNHHSAYLLWLEKEGLTLENCPYCDLE